MTSEKSVMDKRWYVVHTYSGHENKVKTNLERTIKNAGGRTFAESERTAVVNGMPGAAVAAGLADFVLPLDQVAATMAGLGVVLVPEERAVR